MNVRRCWRRDEIRLDMVVTKDKGDGAAEEPPLLYKVVGIVDQPMVVLAPLYERDGEEREYWVISSPAFAEFHEVRAGDEPGSFAGWHYGRAAKRTSEGRFA